MSRAVYTLKLRNSIKNAAQRLAREDGVSLNQWISSAVAQKVVGRDGRRLLQAVRRGEPDGAAMMSFLVDAPDLPEEPSDKGTLR